jgi:hypothetical protein
MEYGVWSLEMKKIVQCGNRGRISAFHRNRAGHGGHGDAHEIMRFLRFPFVKHINCDWSLVSGSWFLTEKIEPPK